MWRFLLPAFAMMGALLRAVRRCSQQSAIVAWVVGPRRRPGRRSRAQTHATTIVVAILLAGAEQ